MILNAIFVETKKKIIMKKVIIGLSALLIGAFVTIMVVNAQDKPQEAKKCGSEAVKDCNKGPNTTSCCKMKYGTTAEAKPCEQAKCQGKECDHANCKEANCSHENCKNASASAGCEAKKCTHEQAKTGSQN